MSNDWTKRERDIHDIIIRNVMGYSKGGICFLIRLLPANAKIWNVVIDGVIDTSPEGFNPGGVLLLGSGDGEYGKNPVDGMKYITVSNNRNANGILYAFYYFPIRARLIHLRASARVNCNRARA